MPNIKKELEVINVDEEDNYNNIRQQISNTIDDKINNDNQPDDKPTDDKQTDDNKAEDVIKDIPDHDNTYHKDTPDKSQCRQVVANMAPKMPCPDCGRLLSKKTLTYTHKYQCTRINKKEKGEELDHPPPKPQIPSKNEERGQTPSYIRKPPVKRYEHINLF